MALVTVLYEDSRIGRGEYPLHRLVLRLVEDEINGETWRIRRLVEPNPRNGIDKVLADVRATATIAGAGKLFVLVDRDEVIAHVNQNAAQNERRLQHDAVDDAIANAVAQTSDAADRLGVFILHPNLEGLIETIERCAPGRWPDQIASARRKIRLDGESPRISRDFVLGEVAKQEMKAVRECVRSAQPGLHALARALAAILARDPVP